MPSISDQSRDIFEADGRGLQHNGLRKANERAVLTIIAFNPGVSNAEISRVSGLAPQTVSAILANLEEAGLLSRGEVLRGRRGQPATPIYLRADGGYAVGCEISWRHMDVVMLNMHAEVLGHIHTDYSYPDATTIVGQIGENVRTLLDGLIPEQHKRITGLGLAMPTQMWRHLHHFGVPPEQVSVWQEYDILGQLVDETGLEVSVYNDGNAACWAELLAFPRPRPADFMYFLVSDFIAAGIVGQGTLWEGPSGNSANLGSMLIHNGSDSFQVAHSVASINAFVRQLEAAGLARPEGPLHVWNWDHFEPVLSEWIETSAAALARVIFNTAVVIETRMAIIDGAMPRTILQRLIERVSHHLEELPVATFIPPQVMAGHLGPLAPAMGAAELPIYRRFFSRRLADIVG